MVQTNELDDVVKGRILQQVEFYFSDSNAPRDKFLFSKIQDDPEGYVDIALICSFSRMQLLLFKAGGERVTDIPPDTVAKVAEVISTSEQLELNPSRTRLRRTDPLDPEAAIEVVDGRSIYAKPFPFDVTLDGLMQFWNKVAPTRGVRLRRHTVSLDFKGSIFVEFESQTQAEHVLQLQLEHAGAPLYMEPKVTFLHKKALERKEKAAAEPTAEADNTAQANGKEPAAAAATAAPSTEAAPEQPSTSSFVSGSVLRLDFDGEGALPDFNAIKEAFGGREAGVRFVEVAEEGTEAFVRFESAEKATEGLQKASVGDTFKFGERQATAAVLQGDAEQDFAARQAQKFQKAQTEGGRGRKRPHDGQGPPRGRGRGRRGRGRR